MILNQHLIMAQTDKTNKYYQKDLFNFFRQNIPSQKSILEIGCGTGNLIKRLNPYRGVGIDISEKKIKIAAKQKNNNIKFICSSPENLNITEKFDYIIISHSLAKINDIQKVFQQIKKISLPESRIIIAYHNFLWQPILKISEWLNLKEKQERLNWLNRYDIVNLLTIEEFEIIKSGNRFLFPLFIPLVSEIINRYLAQLPILNKLCLTGFIIARPIGIPIKNKKSVSVIIPARNEEGNIKNLVKRIPDMGEKTELIFVEGGSKDNTLAEIKKINKIYGKKKTIKYMTQNGTGKGDAVRMGFQAAKGDILMILDADLSVRPEDLPKFYHALICNKGELIIGSRLVYPLKKESMRLLNIIGNKFFSLAFSWLLGQKIKDTLCGTKVISKENYSNLAKNRKYFGDFDPFGDFDLIFGAAKLNLKILEIPIRYQPRQYGKTNISRFRHGWLLLKMTVFALNKIKFTK